MDLDRHIPGLVFGIFVILGSLIALAYLACLGTAVQRLLTLPLRRRLSACQFLDLLALAIEDQRQPEQVLCDACSTADPAIHVRVHLLAAYIAQGASLADALRLVPNVLPGPIRHLILAGLRTGNLARILPQARSLLDFPQSNLSLGLRGMHAILLITSTIGTALATLLTLLLLPRFFVITSDMSAGSFQPAGAVANFVSQHGIVLAIALGLTLPILAVSFLLSSFSGHLATPGLDLFRLLVPWHRLRVQRNFALLLGASLDAGLPEEQCLLAAAAASGNRAFEHRCHRALNELRRGVPLHQAVGHLEKNPGFLWRLRTALSAHGMASTAMASWVGELEARARNRELLAAHLFCLVLLFAQAAIVGLFSFAVFQHLQGVIDYATTL